MDIDKKDLVGIGIGPSNLSLAALSATLNSFSSIFFDKQKNFEWHKGMQIPGAKLQVSYLKDLVTLVDPSNPYSFLSFLSTQKRLYQFINASFQQVSRSEFSQYYRWVCESLSGNLMFDNEVKNIKLVNDEFLIQATHKAILTKSIILGNGLSPFIPDFAKPKIGKAMYHSSTFMDNEDNYANKIVAIVGGGQSSAEILLHLLSKNEKLPKKIIWISRRDNFLPLDDSPFVNDLFTPEYSNYFYDQTPEIKNALIKKQKMFSDGISHATLEEIYKRLYELKFIHCNEKICELLPASEVIDISKNSPLWCLKTKNKHKEIHFEINADIVILCTGYQYELPLFLNELSDKIHRDKNGNIVIKEDFSLSWDGPEECRIYVQNGALHCRGIADPNLSLIPWRSAMIINSINKKEIYDVNNSKSFFNWHDKVNTNV